MCKKNNLAENNYCHVHWVGDCQVGKCSTSENQDPVVPTKFARKTFHNQGIPHPNPDSEGDQEGSHKTTYLLEWKSLETDTRLAKYFCSLVQNYAYGKENAAFLWDILLVSIIHGILKLFHELVGLTQALSLGQEKYDAKDVEDEAKVGAHQHVEGLRDRDAVHHRQVGHGIAEALLRPGHLGDGEANQDRVEQGEDQAWQPRNPDQGKKPVHIDQSSQSWK